MLHRLGRMTAWPCSRRGKWLMLAAWVVLLGVAGPLAGKLQHAEVNDPSTYLPAGAQSTQELHLQSRFVPANLNPAVVIYQHHSSVTPADRAKAAADARAFAALPAVHGRVTGPVLGRRRRSSRSPGGRTRPAKQSGPRRPRAVSPCRRAGRHHRRRVQDRQKHRQHTAARHRGGGHRAAAGHLPQPSAMAAAHHLRPASADRGRGGHLPADPARPDRERGQRRWGRVGTADALRVTLKPLDAAAVAAVAEDVLGGTPDPALLAVLAGVQRQPEPGDRVGPSSDAVHPFGARAVATR
jgi:hypothetical protein